MFDFVLSSNRYIALYYILENLITFDKSQLKNSELA